MYEAFFTKEGAERVVAKEKKALPKPGQEIWLAGSEIISRPAEHPPGHPYLIRTLGCGTDTLRQYIKIAKEGDRKKK